MSIRDTTLEFAAKGSAQAAFEQLPACHGCDGTGTTAMVYNGYFVPCYVCSGAANAPRR